MRSKNPTRLCWLALLMTAIAAYAFVNRPISSSIEWGDDLEAALSSARQGHTRVVLEFSASWCGYCRLMEREVLTDPRVERELERLVPVRLDWSSEPGLAARFGVEAVPTFLVLSEDGNILGRSAGYQPVDAFIRFLQHAAVPARAGTSIGEP